MEVQFETLGGELLLPTDAILDSGADSSMLPLEFAHRMGIDIEQDCVEQAGQGVGGATKHHAYPNDIVGRVFDERLPLRACFSSGLEIVLLGRRDFFHWYQISFDQRKKVVTLDPYEERPELAPLRIKGP